MREMWEVFCGTDSACNLTCDHTLPRLYSDVGKEDMIHLSLFPKDRDTHIFLPPSGLVRTLFSSGYGYRPQYNAENDHRKRNHSKTLFRIERFENDPF